MKLSVRIVFVIFVLSLLFSVVAGLFVVWNPDSISPALGQTIATSVIIMLAEVLYLGVCDAVIRIKSGHRARGHSTSRLGRGESAGARLARGRTAITKCCVPRSAYIDDQQIERAGSVVFLMRDLMSMSAADYENEVAMLNTRYQQIDAACSKPYPLSTEELKTLDQQWTLDDSWKNTKLLRWFRPCWFVHSFRRNGDLRNGLYVGLAAAIKWQKSHGGNAPESLEQALRAIEIDEVPIDPYSGEALRLAVIDNRVVIYSVGPDGDDDKAQRRFNLFGNPADTPERNPDGDVMLQIQYSLN